MFSLARNITYFEHFIQHFMRVVTLHVKVQASAAIISVAIPHATEYIVRAQIGNKERGIPWL